MRDVVTAFFQSESIEAREGPEGTFAVSFSGDDSAYPATVRVDEATEVLAVWTVLPVEVPRDKIGAVLEAIARLNFGHVIGNLELDVDNGVVRMKTSLDFGGEELTDGLVANCVWANVAAVEQMLPKIREVLV
jgi:hypothetical protein